MLTLQSNVSLKNYNTFGIDASTRYWAEVETAEDLVTLFELPDFQDLPKLMLGGGSNILFTQDFAGLVVKINIKGSKIIHEDAEHVWVRVGAGEIWHDFVLQAIKNNWAGIENLSLIPGTVGAAPIQNIGAYGVEIKEVFDSLEALELSTGRPRRFTFDDCAFGYRNSFFKQNREFIILNVTFRLNKTPSFRTEYGDIQRTLNEANGGQLSIKAISDAVVKIRSSKLPNPAELGNAGSFFKNPEITVSQFTTLQKQFPEIPHYATATPDIIKISAAWLIEQTGWKGKRLGNVGVHNRQALVLVNYGGGMGIEIKQLAEKIQASVVEKFNIILVPEVNMF